MRWARRAAFALAAFVVIQVVFTLIGLRPDALRLALLVAACVALLGLATDALDRAAPPWPLEADLQRAPAAGDPQLSRYVGLVEAHLAARHTDRALRDRLGVLADQVLRQRHGLGRHEAGAADLLGPLLTDVLDGPARSLSLTEMDRCLTIIEEL